MVRPRKQTVEYFPHQCLHKKTMFILEEKYGLTGYSFWFKLLELLGSTEGHVYDCRNPTDWEFLQAKTKLPEETCTEILDLLAKLDAIDKELWSIHVVWSQNFVDGLLPVYTNRRAVIPLRPSYLLENISTAEFLQAEIPKGSRVEESRGSSNTDNDYDRESFKKIANLYMNNISPGMGTMETAAIKDWFEKKIDPGLMEFAIQTAVDNNKRSRAYVETVIFNKIKDGILTGEQAIAFEKIRKAKKEGVELPKEQRPTVLTPEQIARAKEIDAILNEHKEE